MKLYKVEGKEKIKEVESERQSDKSLWINGNRHNWISDWNAFFLTYSDAKNYLIKHWESEVNSAQRNLNNKNEKLSKVREL